MTLNCCETGYAELLLREPYEAMLGEFTSWRISDFIRQIEASRSKGRVLPFVRGLRLSAHLIYAVRELLEGTDLTANWGHLLDQNGVFCSPECDIIIHRKAAHVKKWNGSCAPVMDFRFVSMDGALVVINCKSHLTSIDQDYPRQIEEYVKRVWLFCECCGPRSAGRLAAAAHSCGYEHFWHLYTWSQKTLPKQNIEGWNNFVEEVKSLRGVR
jgi:hypothetical protein